MAETSLKIIETIEHSLSGVKEKDSRLFRIWAEYYVALKIAERNLNWRIVVNRNQKLDIECHKDEKNEKPIAVEVKTGKMHEWHNMTEAKSKKENLTRLSLNSADATFSEYQINDQESFQYVVFLVYNDYYKLIWEFVFSRKQLDEVLNGPGRKGNRASEHYLTYAKTLKEFDAWNSYYSRYYKKETFGIEKMLIEHPEKYNKKWEIITL